MNYIFEFDIAAILIVGIVIYFFFNKKNIPTLQNKIFLVILCCLESASILDFVLTMQIMKGWSFPILVLWGLNIISYGCVNFFGPLIACYCLAITRFFENHNKKQNTIANIMLGIPYLILFTMLCLSPVTYYLFDYPLIFVIDSAGGYSRGTGIFYYSLYLICIYYVIWSFWLLIKYRNKVKTQHVVLVILYISEVVAAIVIQLFFPLLLIQCFGVALASLVFLLHIQRPEEVLNSVTECFNQTAFARIVSHQITSSENVTCIAVILDDTHFLSNTFGIARLEDFMRVVADYFKQHFNFNSVFHINLGCFCIVLKDVEKADIQNIVGRIQSRFNQIWDYESIHLKLYSRLCVVDCPKDAKSAEDVLDIISLVTSDERYKQSVVYSADIDLEYKRRTMYIDHAVRFGLADNRLEVYYQPIWSTEKKRMIGAEALIRLRDEDGNFISPEDFIPIAEKNGCILRIGEFVFESVCRTLSAIDVRKYGIEKIDINLSVAQCMQEILAEQILTIRSMYNIPASLINLEITETAAAHTPEILLKNMQHLSDAGFELSLDDYGSGYSNMSYMLNLPFKMIKIDKYIVWSACEEERARIALTATVKMIRQLGMTVLAEGVETEEQLKWLSELGCDYLQGYYFSKPVPRAQYLEIMSKDFERHVGEHPEDAAVEDEIEELEEL